MESLPKEHAMREGRSRSVVPSTCEAGLPGFLPTVAANDTRMSQLARTIEQEIIPRLMLAHRALPDSAPALDNAQRLHFAGVPAIDADDVKRFCKLVLSHDEDEALTAIADLRARHVSVESIYLDLLGPTARYLGELWEEDLCNFTDVTVGLGRLQRVLRELSPALGRSVQHAAHGRRVLLLPSPGEQHTFGLVMVAEFFRRAGWDVTGGAWADGVEACTLVRDEWFDVIGFSLGAEVHLNALATSIANVRHATCNADLKVLVGGPLFGPRPDYARQVGADGVTIDGGEAPYLAESLISQHVAAHAPHG